MFITVVELNPESLEVDRTFPLCRPAELGRGGGSLEEARVRGVIERRLAGFSFEGRVETTAHLECSRCLEPFRLDLALPFDLHYREPPAEGAEPPVARGDGSTEAHDSRVSFLDDGRIDLTQLVEEQVYLALPLKPLCRSGCRGLCPRCGAQRNLKSCDCAPERIDMRLAVLEKLKQDLEG